MKRVLIGFMLGGLIAGLWGSDVRKGLQAENYLLRSELVLGKQLAEVALKVSETAHHHGRLCKLAYEAFGIEGDLYVASR